MLKQQRVNNRPTESYVAGMPYQQMPVLEVDGHKISQSAAIFRYLAREFNLAGKTSLEIARTDEFYEAVMDIMKELPWAEKDEEKKVRVRFIWDVLLRDTKTYAVTTCV